MPQGRAESQDLDVNCIPTLEVTCTYTSHIHQPSARTPVSKRPHTHAAHAPHAMVIMATVLGASHTLTLSKSHLTASLMCLAASIRIQLNHKCINSLFKKNPGASLVVQWLRIHLPMQGTRV